MYLFIAAKTVDTRN